ncbi:MAG TPA: MarR family winged helix-turn-helix transcriptional regulator [Hyphomicrobiaceae bacterium]|jgi:DNA-binding MarR family transcriptional regulator
MTQTSPAKEEGPDQAEELDLGLLADFVGPRVRLLWNLLSARMADALEPYGLRPGAFSALALISANPGCSQKQLAHRLGMDKSAVVAIIHDLDRQGLATRVRHAQDRRFHALKLTPKGQALLQRTLAPASRPGRPIREALSLRELEQLLSLLDRAWRALLEADRSVKPPAGSPRAR